MCPMLLVTSHTGCLSSMQHQRKSSCGSLYRKKVKHTPNLTRINQRFPNFPTRPQQPLNIRRMSTQFAHNNIMPIPTAIAVATYAPSLRRAKSNAGTPTTPAAPLLDVELPEPLEPLDPLDPPVAVGALVTAPVPAEPAWLTTALHELAGLGLTFCAFPEKSQGLAFCVFVAVWLR